MTGNLPILYYDEIKIDFKFDEFTMKSPNWMAKYIGINDDEVKLLCYKHYNHNNKDNIQSSSNKKHKLNDGSIDKTNNDGNVDYKLPHDGNGKTNDSEKNIDKILQNFDENGKTEAELLYKKIKDFYNSYQLIDDISNTKYEIYSPNSITKSISSNKIENYQIKIKGIEESFLEIIQRKFLILKHVIILLLKNEKVDIKSLKFQNDEITYGKRIKILDILVNWGYLGYNSSNKEIFIPNKEIRKIFENFKKSEKWILLDKYSDIYNPGEKKYYDFSKNTYFVDKTELIFHINKEFLDSYDNKNLCVTIPRCFGKTITVDMLKAYYSFSESKITVFDGKKISKKENWDKYLGKFNVIHLNMLKYFKKGNINEEINAIKKIIIEEVKKSEQNFECGENEVIDRIIKKIYYSTVRKIVIIIDEWDYVFRVEYDDDSKKKYIDFLLLLIKDNDELALTYMTGNLPREYYNEIEIDFKYDKFTMKSPSWMAKYIGINDDEVKLLCYNRYNHNNKENTQRSSNKKRKLNDGSIDKTNNGGNVDYKLTHKLDGNGKSNDSEKNIDKILQNFDENGKTEAELLYKKIKDFYNSYQLTDDISNKKYEIYSPNSITKSISSNKIENYQIKIKGIEESFLEIIQRKFLILKHVIILLLKNEKVDIKSLKFQNDEITYGKRIKILDILVNWGYLGYNSSNKEIFIPNKEIRKIFENFKKSKKWILLDKYSDIYNPGEKKYYDFSKNTYFVDKTELIFHINKKFLDSHDNKNLCVTMPHRFGKTITVDMLKAYYSFSESKITVFDGKKISKKENWDKYLGKFNVIHLNMLKYFKKGNINEEINAIKKIIIEEVKKSVQNFECGENEAIDRIIKKIYYSTGRKIIFLIDEWDYVLRVEYDDDSEEKYMNFLLLLSKDNYELALTYMTGNLPRK
eukprot:jgi/Orpsp1_1/1185139/evm.model.c7180000092479.1